MEVFSMIVSICIWGVLLFGVGYGVFNLIKRIKHKRKNKGGSD